MCDQSQIAVEGRRQLVLAAELAKALELSIFQVYCGVGSGFSAL